MLYTEWILRQKYSDNVALAIERLGTSPFGEDQTVNFSGLNGWVFEQTVRIALHEELRACGLGAEISEQVTLKGESRVDLKFGNVAVELKKAGWFGDLPDRYARYRKWASERGWHYIYLALDESHHPHRIACKATFGPNNSFFLDESGSWGRFLDRVKGASTPLE